MKIRPSLLVPIVILVLVAGGTASSAAGPRTPDNPSVDAGSAGVQPHATLPVNGDSVFHTLAPCRIVDSRHGDGAHNIFNSGTQRTVTVAGTAGFVQQGGKSGGCGIPPDANGITASVTTTQSANVGYLVGWPTGTPKPLANFATYARAIGMTVGANLSMTVNNAAGLTLYNFGGPTHVIIDVTGYYTRSDSVLVNVAGVVYYGGLTVLAASHPSLGNYVVNFDHSLVGCSVVATAWSVGSNFIVYVDYLGAGSHGGLVNVHVRGVTGTPQDAPIMVQTSC